jgi:molybdopterin-guanine dinucleotide biosynthesis protein A
MAELAAVVLAGGAARRMGGVDKPAIAVAGQSMRDRVLAAVAAAEPRVVVGPAVDLPPGVLATREDPPGGGPVAATAAGLIALKPRRGTGAADREPVPEFVALLAADLPLLTPGAVRLLVDRLAGSTDDVVFFRDDDGRRQLLCGVWRTSALAAGLDRLAERRGGTLAGAAIRALAAELTVAEVSWTGSGPPPWFDCDTDDDVRQVEEWTR